MARPNAILCELYWVNISPCYCPALHLNDAHLWLLFLFINLTSVCTGWGASGTWVIDDQGEPNYAPPQQPGQIGSRGGFGGGYGGSPCWVPASNGQVPPDAVEGW